MNPEQDSIWFRALFQVGTSVSIHFLLGGPPRALVLTAGIALIVAAVTHKPHR